MACILKIKYKFFENTKLQDFNFKKQRIQTIINYKNFRLDLDYKHLLKKLNQRSKKKYFQKTLSSQQMKPKQKYDFMSKLIVIGDSGVGKTNIIIKFTQQKFKDNYVATIGVDFKVKTISVDDKKIRLQIWDTAGQQRYRNITQTYYKGAAGIVLVYAVNDKNTFLNLEKWIIQMQQKTDKNIKKIIVGNKCDLDSKQRQVTYQEGLDLAKKYSTLENNVDFLEVSARNGQNIEETFYNLGKKIKQDLQTQYTQTQIVKISKSSHKKPNSYCQC